MKFFGLQNFPEIYGLGGKSFIMAFRNSKEVENI